MDEVRRDDGELCGHVAHRDSRWVALTVFGVELSDHDTEDEARSEVVDLGLAALTDRWTLIDGATGEEQTVCIQQASPVEVTLALGYYAVPGTPSMTVHVDELRSGRWRLRL